MSKLDELRKLEQAATAGRWNHVIPEGLARESNFRLQIGNCVWPINSNDADFIAAAKNAMPALLRVVDAAKGLQYQEGCFCEVSIGNPMYSDHTKACKEMTTALRDLEGDK